MVTLNTRELFYGILANSPMSVNAFLEKDDTDPNGVLHLSDLIPDSFRDKMILSHFDAPEETSVTPLLLSTLLLYKNGHGEHLDSKTKCERSYTIVLDLLKHGANVCQDCNIKSLTLTRELRFNERSHHLECIRPYELAQCLLDQAEVVHQHRMQHLLDLFQEHETRKVPVRASAAIAWKSLLFSESTSDVHFCCNDGTVLNAHKCILSASTPFFERYFQGPWGSHSNDNTWNTDNPAEVMRVVLTFLYTGEIDKTVLESDPVGLFVVACEYEITALKHLAERTCMNGICMENIADMLIVSHLHASEPLKRSCANFVREENPAALVHPSVTSIASEQPELWKEIQMTIGSNKKMEDGDEEERGVECSEYSDE